VDECKPLPGGVAGAAHHGLHVLLADDEHLDEAAQVEFESKGLKVESSL
jgi:hypothetical protein